MAYRILEEAHIEGVKEVGFICLVSLYRIKIWKNILRHQVKFTTNSYLERGSDERQYNAPGIELPVVCYCRSKFQEYPEYHTSADDMSLITPSGFQGSYEVMTQVIMALEYNAYYRMKVLYEPQLGKRGLYPTVSIKGAYDTVIKVMKDFMAYADGRNDLIEISDIIGVSVKELIPIVEELIENELIEGN